MKQSLYKKIVLSLLGKMKHGQLKLSTASGDNYQFGNGNEILADIKVNDEVFFKRVVLYGDVGFGESYMEGLWETSNLTNVISFFILNMAQLPSMSGAKKTFNPINLLKITNRIDLLLRPNSLKGSRVNISKHYDLSNAFFKLFLDPSMTYSSAVFKKGDESLETAQLLKYESLCNSIKVKSSDHILEIGCGWGGFSVYAAKNYGCKVTGITISKEQYNYAVERVKKECLEKQVEIVFQDYRKIGGAFDKVVSIEMIEAVGHKYFRTYFCKIDQLLKPGGVLGLQAIIIPDNRYNEYRKSVDWIQKHIFPGGLLPSIGKINETVNQVGNLNLYSLEEFGKSYALTLRTWYDNFLQNLPEIRKLGFDDVFLRKWEYYLCSCEAAFEQRNINVVQMVYARPNNPNF